MTEMMSQDISKLAEALSKAQGLMTAAGKDKQNPYFKSSYADLNSIWEACRKPLSENGLSVMQTVEYFSERMFLSTTLAHSSGQWIKSTLPLNPVKLDPQSVGSAITYGRRYALSAIVGVYSIDEDDDGEEAMGRNDVKEAKFKKEETVTASVSTDLTSEEKIEQIAITLCENLHLPEEMEMLDYLCLVDERREGRPFNEIVDAWLKDPQRFKDSYGKWKQNQLLKKKKI